MRFTTKSFKIGFYTLQNGEIPMNIHIIYAHPSTKSFTQKIKSTVIQLLQQRGHSWTISDLYAENFQTDMSEEEYLREAFYKKEISPPKDVLQEQQKILNAQSLIFIYPIFWTEAPAKLKGWFDRVWTYGFAYEDCIMPYFESVFFLASAGNTQEHLYSKGFFQAMETVMCKDRIGTRAKYCKLHLFTETSRGMENRELKIQEHIKTLHEIMQFYK